MFRLRALYNYIAYSWAMIGSAPEKDDNNEVIGDSGSPKAAGTFAPWDSCFLWPATILVPELISADTWVTIHDRYMYIQQR